MLFWLIFIANYLIGTESSGNLFAGNGLITYSYTILDNETIEINYEAYGDVIEINCTTYNDCYDLLCSFLFQPVYLVNVIPHKWNKNCDELDLLDNRSLSAIFDIYDGETYIDGYLTNTVSGASFLLCMLNKYNDIKISYFGLNCSFYN